MNFFSTIFSFYAIYWKLNQRFWGSLYLLLIVWSLYIATYYRFPLEDYFILSFKIILYHFIFVIVIQIIHTNRFRKEFWVENMQKDHELIDNAYGKGIFNFYCNSYASLFWSWLLFILLILGYMLSFFQDFIVIPYLVNFIHNFLALFTFILFLFFSFSNLLNIINLFKPIKKS